MSLSEEVPVDSWWRPHPDDTSHVTVGEWMTEAESVAELDRLLEANGLFTVFREVTGQHMQPRIGQQERSLRIDRLCIPKVSTSEQGIWTHGAIGFECKRSGVKLGPAAAQAADYQGALWKLRGGIWVAASYVFVWPAPGCGGTAASLLHQFGVGTAHPQGRNRLGLYCGQTRIATLAPNEIALVNPNPSAGRKTGSR